MPLIIITLILIVIFLNIKDSSKNSARQAAIHEKNRRKTNAKLEHHILDGYMKYGYSFDDAFKKSYEDMISAGYDPCIPRSAYKNRDGVESSSCGIYGGDDVERYDSSLVQKRRDEAKAQWQQEHPDTHVNYAPREEIDAMVYQNFPKNEYEYLHYLKVSTKKLQAEPVGTFIIYPGLGTCEILAHNWIGDGAAGGTYTLKVLKTGQIVTYVKIGDNKIRKQG